MACEKVDIEIATWLLPIIKKPFMVLLLTNTVYSTVNTCMLGLSEGLLMLAVTWAEALSGRVCSERKWALVKWGGWFLADFYHLTWCRVLFKTHAPQSHRICTFI